jgi:hypothetical protein
VTNSKYFSRLSKNRNGSPLAPVELVEALESVPLTMLTCTPTVGAR